MAWCHDISKQNSRMWEKIPCATEQAPYLWTGEQKPVLNIIITYPKALSLLFWSSFLFFLSGCEMSERIARLLLGIHSWPKVCCANTLVAFSLVLLRLIWLTPVGFCIACFLTRPEEVCWSKLIEAEYSASHFGTITPPLRHTVQS